MEPSQAVSPPLQRARSFDQIWLFNRERGPRLTGSESIKPRGESVTDVEAGLAPHSLLSCLGDLLKETPPKLARFLATTEYWRSQLASLFIASVIYGSGESATLSSLDWGVLSEGLLEGLPIIYQEWIQSASDPSPATLLGGGVDLPHPPEEG